MLRQLIFFNFVISSCLVFLPHSFADSPKVFTLKDGSVIHGNLESYQNGIYVVQTQNLGRLELKDDNVVGVSQVNLNVGLTNQNASEQSVLPSTGNFSNQVTAMQNQMMGNPQTMQAIAAMAEDPEIMAILADPTFAQQVMASLSSNNPQSMSDNPRIQQLMSNPKMQALIQQVQPTVTNSQQ